MTVTPALAEAFVRSFMTAMDDRDVNTDTQVVVILETANRLLDRAMKEFDWSNETAVASFCASLMMIRGIPGPGMTGKGETLQ